MQSYAIPERGTSRAILTSARGLRVVRAPSLDISVRAVGLAAGIGDRAGAAGGAAVAVAEAPPARAAAYDTRVALRHAPQPWDRDVRHTLRRAALPETAELTGVVAFAVRAPARDAQVFSDLAWYLTELRRPGTRWTGDPDACYAIVPGDNLLPVVREVVAELRWVAGAEVLAGVGGSSTGAGHVERSRAEADRVLDVLRRRPDLGPVADLAEVHAQATVRGVAALLANAPHLRLPQLATLRAHDEARGTCFVATLAAYFARFGSVEEAAAEVGVHPNTFRYRLRRIESLLDADFADPVERLAYEVQLAAGAPC